jgi:hypothetical protein
VFSKDVKVPLQEAELVGTSSSNRLWLVVQFGDTVFALRSGEFLTKERNWPVLLSNYCS